MAVPLLSIIERINVSPRAAALVRPVLTETTGDVHSDDRSFIAFCQRTDREVVHHSAIDVQAIVQQVWREQAGQSYRCGHNLGESTSMMYHRSTSEQVDRHAPELAWQLLDHLVAEEVLDRALDLRSRARDRTGSV